jgi:alcohol dehydrogenase
MRPQVAVVDPNLTMSLPPPVTLFTGVDALAQAIGAMIVTNHSPVSDALGLEACRLIGRSLKRAVADGHHVGSRVDMAAGSLLAGLAMNLSESAADHPLAEAIGGLFGLPHGLTVGLVLVETLEVNRVACAAALDRIGEALGETGSGVAAGERGLRAIRRLMAQVSFPVCRDVGVGPEHLEELVEHAVTDELLAFNPRPWGDQEVRTAFSAALARYDRR